MPFMVLVYGPLGGCCNYTAVAPLSTSSEVCGTGRGTPEWQVHCPESSRRALPLAFLSLKELSHVLHSANS